MYGQHSGFQVAIPICPISASAVWVFYHGSGWVFDSVWAHILVFLCLVFFSGTVNPVITALLIQPRFAHLDSGIRQPHVLLSTSCTRTVALTPKLVPHIASSLRDTLGTLFLESAHVTKHPISVCQKTPPVNLVAAVSVIMQFSQCVPFWTSNWTPPRVTKWLRVPYGSRSFPPKRGFQESWSVPNSTPIWATVKVAIRLEVGMGSVGSGSDELLSIGENAFFDFERAGHKGVPHVYYIDFLCLALLTIPYRRNESFRLGFVE